jgi:hypothetical protein
VRYGGWACTVAWKTRSRRATWSWWTARWEFSSLVSFWNRRCGEVCRVAFRPSSWTRTAPTLASGSAAISRSRRPEPVTSSVCPASAGTVVGRTSSSWSGKRRRTSGFQPRESEMFPAPASLASISLMRAPACPMFSSNSSRSGNGAVMGMAVPSGSGRHHGSGQVGSNVRGLRRPRPPRERRGPHRTSSPARR